VSVNIRGPAGFSQQEPWLLNRTGLYSILIMLFQAMEHRECITVEYLTTINAQTLKNFGSFDVKGYNLYLKPIGGKVKELEGFPPGESGFIIVSVLILEAGISQM